MEGLPKFAQQRLKQRGAAPGSGPGGPEHPDADLLTAFVEKRLNEGERSSIVSHLAACADCREVVALASAPGVEATTPTKAPGRRPAWFTFPVVRWGVVAAAVGIVVVSVILHRPEVLKLREPVATQVKPEPVVAPAETAQQSQPQAAAPQTTEAQAGASRAQGVLKSQRAAGESQSEIANLQQAEAKREAAAGAASTASGLAVANAPQAAGAKQESAEGYSVGGPARAGAQPNVVVLEPGQSVTITKAPKSDAAGAANRRASVTADKVEQATETQKEAPPATAGVASAPSVPAPQPVQGLMGAATETAPASPLRAAKAKGALTGTRWSISSEGKVERSSDHGKTWEELRVDESAVFRAVAAAGSEVWAGGSKGALYHSTDAGANWARVTPRSEGASLSDDIVGIRFPDSRHVTLSTLNGETWTTSDGGEHWEVR